ncbi:MAG: DUF11 domain-containing protein [Actinobacteria bacterium]|nr:MAG: DUF11 domain-containing protein [Actinomycetota bacterium]
MTNVGDTDLANVVLDDSSNMTWPPFALPAGGAPVDITYSTTPAGDTLNTATATGTDPLGHPVSDTDDASVDLIAPAIQIAKTVDFDGDGAYGELEQGYAASTAHWRVVVTNPGDVALYDVHVTDTNGQDHVIAELPAGGPGVTYEYDTVPGHDLVNEATATGYDRLEREYTASDTAAVDVIAPAISVAKTVDFDGDGVYGESEIGYAGNPAHWRIVVTNTGDVPLTDVDLGDSSSEDFPLFDLAAGASRTFDYSSTVFSDFTNLAEAVGIDPLGNPVTGSDTASVEPFTPGVTISKTVDFNGDGTFSESETYYTGSTAHWIVTVHNSGDVDLTNVVVTDLGHTWGPMTLPAGGPDAVFTYDTADVAADFTNIAGVLAYDPLGAELSATDSASVDVIDPGLAVVKTVDFDGDGTFSEAETSYLGDTAHWKIVVINTGDVTLTNVDVTDSNGESFHVDTLPAGQGNSVEFNYDRVPAGDTVNTVVVTALDPFEQELEATDEASVDTIAPALEIAKTVDYDGDGIYTDSELNFEGETAHWRIVVTNTGDVTLTDVDITDTNGQTHHVDTLPAFEGNSVEFTYDTVPTDDLINVAIASATDPLQGGVGPVEDEAEVIVEPFLPFGEPDVAVDKSADKTEADPGELVNYTITYTNVSTNIAWNIVVTDDYDEDLATVVSAPGGTVSGGKIVWTDAGPLYAGESRSVHYQVRIASDLPVGTTYVDNVVVVKADDDYNPYNDTDNWRVRVRVSEGEEFLPFTGSEGALALLLIAALALVGVSLRRLGRHEA